MDQQDLYMDDELDSEWAEYVASLTSKNTLTSQKIREKRKIEKRERETMINLQKHVRGLSRARFELEDAAINIDIDSSIDDSCSDTGTVNIIDTPISDHLSDLDSNFDSDDDIPPTPIESNPCTPHNPSLYIKPSKRTSIIIDDPYNTKLDEIESMDDDRDSDINDSHSLQSTNGSDDDIDDEPSKSSRSSSNNSLSEDSITELQYDKELEALKQELNQFKRRNFDRKRTKSHEEVLLSVLNIDGKDIDAKQLEKCTKKAINKYNSRTQREKRRVERKKSMQKIPSSPNTMTPIMESPLPPISDSAKYLMKSGQLSQCIPMETKKEEKVVKRKKRKLADPYDEEWNGLDPDDYVWYDNVPEGQCYDDKELSLRNRRIQYLVIMAIENHYCSISDLTYKQNELLLLYQQSLVF